MKVLPCPAQLRCTELATIKAVLTYFKKLQQPDIMLDFAKLQFIDPGSIVLMHHLARTYGRNTIRIRMPERGDVRKYLDNHFKARGDKFALQSVPTSYPMRYIKSEASMIRELGEWRAMLEDTEAATEEDARTFSQNLSEVLVNSFTHGKTKSPCIVAGQTFTKAGHSMLAAVDHGVTIPTTLRNSKLYEGRANADEDWIALALQRGVTCKSRPTNMGYGLFLLTKMVQGNGGSMHILSGKGAVCVTDGGPVRAVPLGSSYDPFPGTLLILDIKIR